MRSDVYRLIWRGMKCSWYDRADSCQVCLKVFSHSIRRVALRCVAARRRATARQRKASGVKNINSQSSWPGEREKETDRERGRLTLDSSCIYTETYTQKWHLKTRMHLTHKYTMYTTVGLHGLISKANSTTISCTTTISGALKMRERNKRKRLMNCS